MNDVQKCYAAQRAHAKLLICRGANRKQRYLILLGVAYRGLFIIDPNQVVRQITINDLPVGRNVDEIVRLVEAFQFTDEVWLKFFV